MSIINETVSASQALNRNADAGEDNFLFNITAPEPAPITSKDAAEQVREFNLTTDAVNLLLAEVNCPTELRALIDALIGVAGKRKDRWFPASDEIVAERLERSTKTVQRYREQLIDWQEENRIAFIEIRDSRMDEEGKRHPHYYRAHISRLAVEIVQAAQDSDNWRGNPGLAIKDAAKQKLDSLPDAPKRQERKKLNPDPESIIAKSLKTAETLLRKALDLIESANSKGSASGSNARRNLPVETLSSIQRSIEKLTNICPYREGEDTGRVQHPIYKVMDTGGDNVPPCVPPILDGGQNVHIETIHSDCVEAIGAFESVGADTFEVTMRDEQTGEATEHKTWDAQSFKANLERYSKRNADKAESFIVRPRGAEFIQLDDLSASEVNRISPVAFLIAETSTENYQAWLALPEGTKEETRQSVRSRLMNRVGGDKGASGAMRLPGSTNRKPGRNNFRVRLHSVQLGRTVAADELEESGLLAPERPNRVPLRVPTSSHNSRREFPYWDRCLESKDGDRSRADASFIKLCLLRGFSREEAIAELERVSPRAQKERRRGRRYVNRTADFVCQ